MEKDPNDIRDTRNWGVLDHVSGGPSGTPPWERMFNVKALWWIIEGVLCLFLLLAVAFSCLDSRNMDVENHLDIMLGAGWKAILTIAGIFGGIFVLRDLCIYYRSHQMSMLAVILPGIVVLARWIHRPFGNVVMVLAIALTVVTVIVRRVSGEVQ